jgi:DNA repair exonuclease SbcCD ATPase subunit
LALNTTIFRVSFNEFDAKVRSLKVSLNLSEELIKKRDMIQDRLNEAKSLRRDLELLKTEMKVITRVVRDEEVRFKEKRLRFVDDNITERLDIIFPSKGLVAETHCDFNHLQTKLRLYLKDRFGNLRPPYVTEGKGAQQLISFTAAESTLRLLGKNILYLDEAFSNASGETLEKIQPMLQKSVEDGFQLIVVSHSDEIYSNLSRREIHLESYDGEFVGNVVIKDF